MIDSTLLDLADVAESWMTVAASHRHQYCLDLVVKTERFGWAFGIEEQLDQPAIAVVVIDVVADAESFVASLLMTMRVDVAEDSVVAIVAVVAAAAVTEAVEWRLVHPVTATLACPREYSNHHFEFLTSFVNHGVVPSGGT
jgi:hypothetical protein